MSKVAPASGSTAGGNRVTITGSHFVGVKAVRFGSVRAKSVKVTSSKRLTAIAPADKAGILNVRVTSRTGTSGTSRVTRYRYVTPRRTFTEQDIPSATGFHATCPAAGVCYGVGYSGSDRYGPSLKPLVETLTKGTWKPVPLKYKGAGIGIAISCSAIGECAALISQQGQTSAVTQAIEVLHEGRWTQTELPKHASWQDLRCTAPQHCIVAGSSVEPGRTAFLTIDRSTVTETQGPTLPAFSAGGNAPSIVSVVCAARDWCVAWGSYYTDGGSRAFAEALDHGTVKDQELPSPAAPADLTESDLSAVVCPQVGVCTGYGNYTLTDGTVRPMKLTLDNNIITATTLPLIQDPTSGSLTQTGGPTTITCTAVGQCVGTAQSSDHVNGYIDTLKADGWHTRAIPVAAGDINIHMASVACTVAEHCYVAANRYPQVTGFPEPRAVEFLPNGSEVKLPLPTVTSTAVATTSTCAAGTGFCLQLAWYGDYESGSTQVRFAVAINE